MKVVLEILEQKIEKLKKTTDVTTVMNYLIKQR